MGGGGTNRRHFANSAANVLPVHCSAVPLLVERRRLKIDVVFLQVTGPDEAGNYSAGTCIEHIAEALAGARTVIAEHNDRLPWTYGDTVIPAEHIDLLVPSSRPLVEVAGKRPEAAERAVAENVARLVSNAATLQLGIGGIPDAMAAALSEKRGLGLHCGIIGDGVVDLVESGIADNRRKEVDEGVTVAMMVLGTRRLYDWADRNKGLSVRSPSYTHDPAVLANFRRFVAVNSAIEVDLTGQVNAETVGGRHVGLIGGQVDFVRAGIRSPEGRAIIALPSTTRDRRHSRIVARLKDGVVTTARSDADFVVTEHGIADLAGLTLGERARAMIAIADPAFRAELSAALDRIC
jgi:acetyl-CoA hydrolase